MSNKALIFPGQGAQFVGMGKDISAKFPTAEKIFKEAAFHNSLFNKLIGIVSLPFILIISYISEIYLDIVVYFSLFLLISVNVLRIIRGVKFVMKNVISYFYFILYLCSLEILPILVIIKILHSL